MKKLIEYFLFLTKIDILRFIYYNYFSTKVVRLGKGKLIPYKHSIIELKKGVKIYLDKGDIEIGCDRLKRSKAETLIRLRENAIWKETDGCRISYGCMIDIFQDAELNSKYFTMNCNSVIVVKHKIHLGHDVMIGRNVIIYDSDFHSIFGLNNQIINQSEEVSIGDHVWLGVNVVVLKGVSIGNGSVISANTLVTKKIDRQIVVGNESRLITLRENIFWNR